MGGKMSEVERMRGGRYNNPPRCLPPHTYIHTYTSLATPHAMMFPQTQSCQVACMGRELPQPKLNRWVWSLQRRGFGIIREGVHTRTFKKKIKMVHDAPPIPATEAKWVQR